MRGEMEDWGEARCKKKKKKLQQKRKRKVLPVATLV